MKNTYNIFIALLLAFILSSCEDRLTQINPNAVTVDDYWQTENDFDMALTATYSGLQFPAINGGTFALNNMRSDLVGTEEWYGRSLSASNMEWTTSTGYVEDSWAQPYIGIFRANQVISNLNKPETETITGFTEDERFSMEAQARFIRAYLYNRIIKNYNGAVLQLDVPVTDSDLRKGFQSKSIVLSEVIYPDLYFAMNNLPWSYPESEDLGRITKGAAKALLGKVYLYEAQWDSAVKYLGQIIYSGNYALTFDQMDNFTEEGEFNSESIFEIGYNGVVADGVSVDRVDEVLGEPGSEGNSVTESYCALFAGGYNTNLPTYWLQELFTVADTIDRSNPHNDITGLYHPAPYDTAGGRIRSNRTYGSIAIEYGDGDYYGDTLSNHPDDGSPILNPNYGQGAKIKKFTRWYKATSEENETDGRTGINYRAIRLADVYLMYAEALLELNGAGSLDSALYFVDQVRERAGTFTLQHYIDITFGGIPKFDDSPFAAGRSWYTFVPFNADNLLHHIKMVERPLELCFEGQRWHDLVRWEMVAEVFAARRAEEINLWAILTDPEDPGEIPDDATRIYPLYLNERVRADFEIPNGRLQSNAEYYYYYPVPSIETERNSSNF